MITPVNMITEKHQERDLTAMRDRHTLLRAEAITAPFLRPARRLKLNTAFEMVVRRIGWS